MERGRKISIGQKGSRQRVTDAPRASDWLTVPHPVNPAHGRARLVRFRNPFDLLYVATLDVRRMRRGHGFGRDLLIAVNDVIKGNGVAGLLFDEIDQSTPAAEMYVRHGWVPVPGHENWHHFNVTRRRHPQIPRAIERINEALP